MFLYHKSFDWRLLQYSRSCLLASSADPPALIPCKKKIKNQAQLFVQGLNSDVRTRNKRTLKPTQKRLSSQTVFPEQLFGDLVPIVYVWEHGTHPVQTQQTFFFFPTRAVRTVWTPVASVSRSAVCRDFPRAKIIRQIKGQACLPRTLWVKTKRKSMQTNPSFKVLLSGHRQCFSWESPGFISREQQQRWII